LEYLGLAKDMSINNPRLPELIVALVDKLQAVEERIDALVLAPRDAAGKRPLEGDVMAGEPDALHHYARAILLQRCSTAQRLRRLNLELSAWDEHDAAQAMPADVRLGVRAPTVERVTVKQLPPF
jgi:hypothetical protein